MASLLISSLILMFVTSNTVLAKSRENGVTLKAPLIHWSSPESPYYKPNATAAELLQASVHVSRARSKRIGYKSSGKHSGKWAVSPVSYTLGEFVMKFSVGTPAVDTYAVPDTASDLVWFQCSNCSKCYKQPIPLFDPAKSITYKTLQCQDPDCKKALWYNYYDKCKSSTKTCVYLARYMDGSYSEGVISEDTFTFLEDRAEFGNYTIIDAIFGCGFNNSQSVPGPGGYDAPGIVGMTSLPSSLVSQLTLGHQKLFSYCIAVPKEGKQNGNIQIQFAAAASVSGHSTALAPNEDGFYIFRDVDGLYSDDEKIKGPDWVFNYTEGGNGGIYIDTGTTHTLFHTDIIDNLVEVLKGQIPATDYIDFSNSDFPLCYLEEDYESISFPEIELRFKNSTTKYPFTVENTWIDNNKGQFCLAFFRSEGHSILGMTQQRGIKFGYDLEANTVSFMWTNNCNPF